MRAVYHFNYEIAIIWDPTKSSRGEAFRETFVSVNHREHFEKQSGNESQQDKSPNPLLNARVMQAVKC